MGAFEFREALDLCEALARHRCAYLVVWLNGPYFVKRKTRASLPRTPLLTLFSDSIEPDYLTRRRRAPTASRPTPAIAAPLGSGMTTKEGLMMSWS